MTTTLQVPDYLCGENQYQTKENILLLQAASDGDIDKLREALESGANPNYKKRMVNSLVPCISLRQAWSVYQV